VEGFPQGKLEEKERKMDAYAILETGGKQMLVKVGDKIEIEKLSVEAGQETSLDTVCAVSDGTSLKVGAPYVEGATVTLVIDGHKRGDKVINFKAKRRKGSRRKVGHRQDITVATVKAIA
jgi:large subunit ribosomal protein L21